MDPLSLSASAAGLMGLATEITKIIGGYISGVNSASQDALKLTIEVDVLCHVLKLLNEILRGDEVGGTFHSQSILRSVLDACQGHVTIVYKKLAKLNSANKATVFMGKIAWPFHKDECQQCSQALHRYTQTLQVLVMASNRLVSEPIYYNEIC